MRAGLDRVRGLGRDVLLSGIFLCSFLGVVKTNFCSRNLNCPDIGLVSDQDYTHVECVIPG